MAKSEAERAANRNVNKACWVGAGMTLIGTEIAMMWHSSSPDPAAFAGKSPEYIRAYTDAYNSRVKKIQTGYSCIGCVSALVIGGCIIIVSAINESNNNCGSSSSSYSCSDGSN